MLPPTLFFTLYVDAIHEVTHVIAQPFKEGDKSEDQRNGT